MTLLLGKIESLPIRRGEGKTHRFAKLVQALTVILQPTREGLLLAERKGLFNDL